MTGPLAIAGLGVIPTKPTVANVSANTTDAAGFVHPRSNEVLTALRHPLIKPATADQTDATIFSSPEFKNARTNGSLVWRVNPQISSAQV